MSWHDAAVATMAVVTFELFRSMLAHPEWWGIDHDDHDERTQP